MAVCDKYRGRKLGQKILEFLEQKARDKSCKKIVLQARQNAIDFYKAMGYEVEGKTFLLFDSIQHYRMSKQLL